MAIRLAHILNAREAWKKLLEARLGPALAYKIARYVKGLEAEDQTLETRRNELIRRYGSEVQPGTFTVRSDIPNFAEFAQEMGELLAVETNLEPLPIDFASVVESLSAFDGNALSVGDCGVLEPFFKSEAG